MVEHAGTATKCLKLIDFNLLNVTTINKVLNTFKIEPRGEDKRATYTREKKLRSITKCQTSGLFIYYYTYKYEIYQGGGKLMSRIKERVFLMLLSIPRAHAKSARETHTQRETSNTNARTHTSTSGQKCTRTRTTAKKGNPSTTGVAD